MVGDEGPAGGDVYATVLAGWLAGRGQPPAKNPVLPLDQWQHGVLPELPARIELATFSLRVRRSTN